MNKTKRAPGRKKTRKGQGTWKCQECGATFGRPGKCPKCGSTDIDINTSR